LEEHVKRQYCGNSRGADNERTDCWVLPPGFTLPLTQTLCGEGMAAMRLVKTLSDID
jgi:hypothetical protein